jgi:hypothetical protein
MILTKCNNGHFYDAEKYAQCPHCGSQGSAAGDQTVSMNRNDSVTVSLTQSDAISGPGSQEGISSLKEAVQKATIGGTPLSSDGDSVTMSYYSKSIGAEPVVGWLVCTGGECLGEDFRLKSGRNFIGRASGMDVSISGDNTVSREKHAVIVYDPKSMCFWSSPARRRNSAISTTKPCCRPKS